MKNLSYRQTGTFTHAKPETHDTNSALNSVNLNKQKTQPEMILLQLVCNQSHRIYRQVLHDVRIKIK